MMGKIREKLTRFMYGRYGIDEFGYALWVFYLVLLLVQLFAHSLILNVLLGAVLIYTLIRMLSRNFDVRRKENGWYLRRRRAVLDGWILCRNRWRDRKTAVYRRCPACKAVIKLPHRKGKHTVCCPRCHKRFEVRVFGGQI